MSLRSRPALALLLLLAPLAAACGKKGPPMPPLRTIPRASTDLTVSQRGAALLLDTAYPNLTTAGRALVSLEAVEVLRLDGPAPAAGSRIDPRQFAAAARTVLRLAPAEFAPYVRGDRLVIGLPVPAAGESDTSQTYGVRFIGPSGDRSDLSNLVTLSPWPTPPAPPSGLEAEGRPEGVALSWAAPAEASSSTSTSTPLVGFNVYRRSDSERTFGALLTRAAADARSFVDASAALGGRYVYSVTSVASTDPLIESAIAAERQVDFRDRFPPPVPTGLIALAEADAVRLSWSPVEATDLAGYHLYQQAAGEGPWTRRTSTPSTVASFRLTALAPGGRYRFRVTAIDNLGNESVPSGEVEAALP